MEERRPIYRVWKDKEELWKEMMAKGFKHVEEHQQKCRRVKQAAVTAEQ